LACCNILTEISLQYVILNPTITEIDSFSTSNRLSFGLNLEKLFLIYTLKYACDRKIQKKERKTFQKFAKTKD
jgi:hypothetical protein